MAREARISFLRDRLNDDLRNNQVDGIDVSVASEDGAKGEEVPIAEALISSFSTAILRTSRQASIGTLGVARGSQTTRPCAGFPDSVVTEKNRRRVR